MQLLMTQEENTLPWGEWIFIVIPAVILYVFLHNEEGGFGNRCNLALKFQIEKETKYAKQFKKYVNRRAVIDIDRFLNRFNVICRG
jgi:hypothetical protein